jgi:hypothetical protein
VKLNPRPSAESATSDAQAGGGNAAPQGEKVKDVPEGFEEIDFKNFAYPTTLRKRYIQLKDGTYEYQAPGEMGGDTFEYRGVDYTDVTGDGRKEAFVRLVRVSCGASCDGGSYLFYIYSARQPKPSLLWRIESGSLAYECGLKSFVVNERTITFEVFRKCDFAVNTVRNKDQEGPGKFDVKFFTRFKFKFDGKTFALRGKEVFPYSGDVMNYDSEIKISDD